MYWPIESVNEFIISTVGPAMSIKIIKIPASAMLVLLKYLIPLPIPLHAEIKNNTVTTAIRIS